MAEAFIYDAIRTPRGRGEWGSLYHVKPLSLVTSLIGELRRRHPELDPERLDNVLLGVVCPVGDQGMNIAKAATPASGLPDQVGGVQLHRFCASGLEAVNTAVRKVRSGGEQRVIAGGVESMSRKPMGSDGGPMAADPETAFDTSFVPQGIGADLIATIEGFSREDVDAYAVRSQERAAHAWSGGYFAKSVEPSRGPSPPHRTPGGCSGRRHDGCRDRVLLCPQRHARSPQGRSCEAAMTGMGYSEQFLAKAVARGRLSLAEADEILARIMPTAVPADLTGCDLAIEAVIEDPDLKLRVFREIEDVVVPDAVLGSDTSTLARHRAGEGRQASGGLYRPALLLPR